MGPQRERAVRTLGLAVPTGLFAIAVAIAVVAPAPLAIASASTTVLRDSATGPALTGPAPPNPFTSGMPATVALGQTSLDARACPASPAANSGCGQAGVAVDAYGDVWVTDRSSNRVLEYKPPFETNMNASFVLGQPSFTAQAKATNQSGLDYPSGVAFDASGDLWVTDSDNNRVVEYVPPFQTGMNASVVIGEPTFNTNAFSKTNASTLDYPEVPVFSPNGDLFVSDYDSNRIVEYTPPFKDGQAASVVLGQANFTTTASLLEPYGLDWPLGLAFSPSGDLWVADSFHDRLVEFVPPFTTNESASLVLGQVNLTSEATGDGPANLFQPWGVGVDSRGDVWAADYSNNRLVEYVPPLSDGMNASVVLGQPAFGSSTSGTSATGEWGPREIAFDPQDDLWEVERENNRVLEYVPSHFAVQFTESGLPGGTEWSVAVGPWAGTSISGGLTVEVANGSYSYQVPAASGYTASPSSGSISVNGTATATVHLSFSQSSAFAGLLWPVVAAVLAIVAVVEAVLLVRRRPKGARPAPTPIAPASPPPSQGGSSPSPPSSGGGPPPGAAG